MILQQQNDITVRPLNASINTDKRSVIIEWKDGTTSTYPFVWLRDNDPAGFHPDTRERQFDISTINLNDEISEINLGEDAMEFSWRLEGYTAKYNLSWLHAHRSGRQKDPIEEIEIKHWRGELAQKGIPRYGVKGLIQSDAELLTFLRDTRSRGISIINGLEDDPESDTTLGCRAGFLRETNFGRIFEVRSKPQPTNLAYTSLALPMHTDLPNQELVPGYQFLHCIKNEAVGGSSIFCDGFAIAEDMRESDPEYFDLLANTSIPFRYHDDEFDIRGRQKIINLDASGHVIEICFNAHLSDTLDLPVTLMENYYRAYQIFMLKAKQSSYTVSAKLCGGEMVVFDNRRILHGREAFDTQTGVRYLRGFYIDRGDLESRIRVLARAEYLDHADQCQVTEGN